MSILKSAMSTTGYANAQNSNNAKANASNVPQQFHQKVVLTVGGRAIAFLFPLLLIYPRVCKCFFTSGNFICSDNYFTECVGVAHRRYRPFCLYL
ncbi:MAG: hypothetical protein V7K95_16515 [Nostoc sp.]